MKSEYSVSEISLEQAKPIIQKYHYLKGVFAEFATIGHVFYGLYRADELVGAVQYANYPGARDAFYLNHFGCQLKKYDGCWEVCRLAVAPIKEYNITSWFLSRTMKKIHESRPVDFIVSVADARMHNGCIYAACNYNYYGLMKGRVQGMETYHFHVFGKAYNGTKCLWKEMPFEKDYEITI